MEEFDDLVTGDVIEVAWNDAWVDAGHWEPGTEVKWPRVAVGYFIEVRQGHLVMAQDYSERDGRWQTPCVLPLPIIESWRVLDPDLPALAPPGDEVAYELTPEGWDQVAG